MSPRESAIQSNRGYAVDQVTAAADFLEGNKFAEAAVCLEMAITTVKFIRQLKDAAVAVKGES